MTAIQAIVMAVLQGVTELFPISSLGHAVILPRLLNWNVDLRAPDWLAYLTVMHLGTAIALFAYFWRDWINFAASLVGLQRRAFGGGPAAFRARRAGDDPGGRDRRGIAQDSRRGVRFARGSRRPS